MTERSDARMTSDSSNTRQGGLSNREALVAVLVALCVGAVATLALGLMAGARSIAMERAVAQFTRRTGALVVVSLFL